MKYIVIALILSLAPGLSHQQYDDGYTFENSNQQLAPRQQQLAPTTATRRIFFGDGFLGIRGLTRGAVIAALPALAGVLASFLWTSFTAGQLNTRISDQDTRLATVEARAVANNNALSATCGALKEIVSTSVTGTVPSTVATPSPNAISETFPGSRTGTGRFVVANPIGTGAVISDISADDVINIANAPAPALGTTKATTALSLADFNLFVGQMISAVDELDTRIRNIVSVTTSPTCPGTITTP